jgi:predicted amidohydrolase
VNGQIAGIHRKCFLWDFDHDYFAAGEEIRPFDTSVGRMGVMICADARLPEIAATLVRKGAEVILQPTAWVNAGWRARRGIRSRTF